MFKGAFFCGGWGKCKQILAINTQASNHSINLRKRGCTKGIGYQLQSDLHFKKHLNT